MRAWLGNRANRCWLASAVGALCYLSIGLPAAAAPFIAAMFVITALPAPTDREGGPTDGE